RDYLNSIENAESNYVTKIDNEPPETSLIVKVTSWCDNRNNSVDELWRTLWKVVIMRTALSHILYSKDLSSKLSKNELIELKDISKEVIPKGNASTSVVNQMRSFIASFNSLSNLEAYLKRELWGSLETELERLIKKMPPMYFFLDQLDDDYEKAPYHWLKCQYGLFSAIFRFVRNNTYGGRLHIVACLRENVYAYVLNTSHGTKYLSEPLIKVLRWDIIKSKLFLTKKIESLDEQYLISLSSDK